MRVSREILEHLRNIAVCEPIIGGMLEESREYFEKMNEKIPAESSEMSGL